MTNNATNFRDAVIENMASVFLGQGHFEEVVTFQVTSGESPIQIVVLNTHDDGGIDQQSHHLVDSRKLTVLVSRNPVVVLEDGSRSDWLTVAGSAFVPKLGNLFERGDGTKWGFQRLMAEDFASFTLTFVSQTNLRAGSKPMGL